MKRERAEGFEPVWDENSRLLVLGSFPSVKSRAQGFYYGNPQNKFWKTLAHFFGADEPKNPEARRAFVLEHGIALWDVVKRCSIVGSSDASIAEVELAELPELIKNSKISAIFCNGGKSYELLSKYFPELLPMTRKLPSTSPANPRFSEGEWHAALSEVLV